MRVHVSQCLKYSRFYLKRYCGPAGYLTLTMNSLVERVPFGKEALSLLMNLWKFSAYSILPLLLAFYHFNGFLLFSLVLLSLFGVIYFSQDILLYHCDNPPNSRLYVQSLSATSSKWPPGGSDTVSILTEDCVVLHGYLLRAHNADYSSLPTIIYFHGNAGNIGHRLPNAAEMVAELNCNVLLVEYRGFGKSTGTPSEHGLFLDARAAIHYVKNNPSLNGSRIVLFGRSLGGAVAIHAATKHSIDDLDVTSGSLGDISASSNQMGATGGVSMLIVENTFTHIADVAQVMFQIPGFNYIPRVFYKNKYASYDKISHVQVPSLFISGQADQLVPPHMMTVLFNKCASTKKRLLKVRGGTHNETWMTSGYYDSIKKFMDEVFSSVHSPSLSQEVHADYSAPLQDPPGVAINGSNDAISTRNV